MRWTSSNDDVGGATSPQSAGFEKTLPYSRRDLGRPQAWVQAVDGIDFAVARGETLGIVGESGCGKSTSARLLMHLVEPDEGTIVFEGKAVGSATGRLSVRDLRRRLQMVFQDSYASLNPRLTIEDSVAFGLKAFGHSQTDAKARVAEILGMVGLEPAVFAQRYPHELSGGQRQRVNIARALAMGSRSSGPAARVGVRHSRSPFASAAGLAAAGVTGRQRAGPGHRRGRPPRLRSTGGGYARWRCSPAEPERRPIRRRHRALHGEIAERGRRAVRAAAGRRSRCAWSFPARNRIMAGARAHDAWWSRRPSAQRQPDHRRLRARPRAAASAAVPGRVTARMAAAARTACCATARCRSPSTAGCPRRAVRRWLGPAARPDAAAGPPRRPGARAQCSDARRRAAPGVDEIVGARAASASPRSGPRWAGSRSDGHVVRGALGGWERAAMQARATVRPLRGGCRSLGAM